MTSRIRSTSERVTIPGTTRLYRATGKNLPPKIELPEIRLDDTVIREIQQIAVPFLKDYPRSNPRLSGWEAEYGLVPNARSGNAPERPHHLQVILEQCRGDIFGALKALQGTLSPETSPSNCEIGTERGYPIEEAVARFVLCTEALQKTFSGMGTDLFAFGKYPLPTSQEEMHGYLEDHPNPYYQYILRRDGPSIINAYDCQGMQMHYGSERDGERTIAIFNAIQDLCPFFAALSASSPVFYHHDRQQVLANPWDSSRLNIKLGKFERGQQGVPRAGYFGVFENFQAFLEKMHEDAQRYRSIAFGGSLVRPPRILGNNPDNGDLNATTIEMSAMDMNPDVELNVALMDIYYRLCQQIGRYHDEGKELPPFLTVLRKNLHQAEENLRQALESSVPLMERRVVDGNGQSSTLEELAVNIFEFLEGNPSKVNAILDLGSEDDSRLVVQRVLREGNVASKINGHLRNNGALHDGRLDRDAVWEAYRAQDNFPSEIAVLAERVRTQFPSLMTQR